MPETAPHRRRRIDRLDVALLLAAAGCTIALALAGCSRPSGTSTARAQEPGGATYTLLQMNLCLSGVAGCYPKVAYPAGVEEAATRIREARPDAVTFNEACHHDVARIARRTGYHLRFSTVISSGAPLPCIRPRGRGRFGVAVLTRAAVERSDSHAFKGQAGFEWRRWLCVTARAQVDVCTAHLATRSTFETAGNDAQCAELARLLARRAAARTVIFGGDVNRRHLCAPAGAWSRTDRSAGQAPGLQHVYGSGALRTPMAKVLPAMYTDHDALLVRAHLAAPR